MALFVHAKPTWSSGGLVAKLPSASTKCNPFVHAPFVPRIPPPSPHLLAAARRSITSRAAR
ncbi:MAG: hypothetical protein J6Y19_09735 [Kiritimatiellae bacterium]|nr:hypothetical protein [Kiritimatiellia bacterium]